jgi:primosomal protein N'
MDRATSKGYYSELRYEPKVGMRVHVSWGARAVVGVVISVNEEDKTVILQSPRTKVIWKYPVKWSQLLHTIKQDIKENKPTK